MLSMDPERVVYASSFSKTVCPGIRVGYLVGPAELIAAIAEARDEHLHLAEHGGAVDRLRVLRLGRDRALDRDGQDGARRARRDARRRRFAASCRRREFVEPQGGYFMWVTLPPGTDVQRAVRGSPSERGVAFVKGTDFLLEGGENTLRLAYSGVTPEQIDEGVARLAEAYRSL